MPAKQVNTLFLIKIQHLLNIQKVQESSSSNNLMYLRKIVISEIPIYNTEIINKRNQNCICNHRQVA